MPKNTKSETESIMEALLGRETSKDRAREKDGGGAASNLAEWRRRRFLKKIRDMKWVSEWVNEQRADL